MILRKELVELSFDISSEEHERRRKDSTYTNSLLSLLNTPTGLINRCMKSLSENVCLLDAVLCVYIVWNIAESLQE